MTGEIKKRLKEKAKIYKRYVKSGFDARHKEELEQKKLETSNLIISAKDRHFREEGRKPLDPTIGPKNIGLY